MTFRPPIDPETCNCCGSTQVVVMPQWQLPGPFPAADDKGESITHPPTHPSIHLYPALSTDGACRYIAHDATRPYGTDVTHPYQPVLRCSSLPTGVTHLRRLMLPASTDGCSTTTPIPTDATSPYRPVAPLPLRTDGYEYPHVPTASTLRTHLYRPMPPIYV